MDPQSRNAILDSVEQLGAGGLSVLYTTHYMEEAERLCDRVGILDEGRLLAEGTRRELVSSIGAHDRVRMIAPGISEPVLVGLRGVAGVVEVSARDAQVDLLVDDAGVPRADRSDRHQRWRHRFLRGGSGARSRGGVPVAHGQGASRLAPMGTPQGRASRTIAEKDLRQRIRDRTALLVGVVLPFALASILALTLGGAAEGDLDLDLGLVDLDGGPSPTGSSRRSEQPTSDRAPLGDRDVAVRRAEEGALDAVFVLPVGFGSVHIRWWRIDRGDRLARLDLEPLVATSIARSFAARLDGFAIAVATASETPEDGPAIADAAAQLPPAASLDISVTADEGVTPSTFTAIGMAVFFLFFTVEFGIRSVIEEREQGTLARLLAAPIRPASVLIGKGLASFVVGVLSTGLLVVATTLLLDASWGPLIGVALLVVTGVATAVAVTGFVATFATTSNQAGNYASVVAVVGGLLGGTFFPISQAPGLLASARFLSPQGWLMEGFTELSTGGGLVGAFPALAGTLVIGVAFGTLAWVRARRMLSP